MLTWEIFRVPMYPCEWFGGPCWNGNPLYGNLLSYYHRTKEEARGYCLKFTRTVVVK